MGQASVVWMGQIEGGANGEGNMGGTDRASEAGVGMIVAREMIERTKMLPS